MYEARKNCNYLLTRYDAETYDLTNLRLNKLLYFIHGWSLASRTRGLVRNHFEAWKLGRGGARCQREAWWRGRLTRRFVFVADISSRPAPLPPRKSAVPLPRYRGAGESALLFDIAASKARAPIALSGTPERDNLHCKVFPVRRVDTRVIFTRKDCAYRFRYSGAENAERICCDCADVVFFPRPRP